jgi:hypothetical protein
VQLHIRLTTAKFGRIYLCVAIQTSRIRKPGTKRRFQGEDEAQFLLRFMNGDRRVHQATLHEIVFALQGLQPVTPITRERFMSGDPTLKQETNRIEAVNRILRQYEAVPVIRRPYSVSGSGFRLEWRPTGDSAARRRQTKGDAHTELTAALIAIGLAQEGRIHSLRRCQNCTRWFFAKFVHSRFCAEDCKNTFHRENPDEKERRRKWARENYWIHRNKNVK